MAIITYSYTIPRYISNMLAQLPCLDIFWVFRIVLDIHFSSNIITVIVMKKILYFCTYSLLLYIFVIYNVPTRLLLAISLAPAIKLIKNI